MLCITHTPQIAAFADNQLLIEKKVRDNRTFTEIHPLDLDGRVQVLARMISGDKVTDLSLANARELIENRRGKRRTITKEKQKRSIQTSGRQNRLEVLFFLAFLLLSF